MSYTQAHLLKGVPFSRDLSHTLYFSSASEQRDYFLSKRISTMENMTYQRKDGVVRWEVKNGNITEVEKGNYLMYRNVNNGGKWYYAFVDDVEYLNDVTVNLHITTDSFQTYMFDMKVMPSLVERKHMKAPTEVYEGLDVGDEYVVRTSSQVGKVDDHMFAIITSTVDIDNPDRKFGGTSIAGVPTPFQYYILPVNKNSAITYSFKGFTLKTFDQFYMELKDNEDLVGKIVSINIMPELPLPYTIKNTGTNTFDISTGDGVLQTTKTGALLFAPSGNQVLGVKTNTYPQSKKTFFNDPKLNMYPYTILEVHDYNGQTLRLQPEHLNTNFNVYERMVMGFNPLTKYTVGGYAGNTNFNLSLSTNVSTDIPVVTDSTAEMMQSNRNALQAGYMQQLLRFGTDAAVSTTIGSALGVGGATLGLAGAVDRNLGSSISNGLSLALNNNARYKDVANQPPKISGSMPNTIFDLAFNQMRGVNLTYKTISDRKAKQLQDFFHKYGYKVNAIIDPLERTRKDYMYIKTIDCVVKGDIPTKDLKNIIELFNTGFTLWYNKDVGNYRLTNEVI